jgi:hypothetical protein
VQFKETTREQWERVAEAWHRWGPTLQDWLGPVMEGTLGQAGFRDIQARTIRSPLRLPSTGECVHFERESFGALQQMLVGLAEVERQAAWDEIELALRQLQGQDGFAAPTELIVGAGTK